MWLTDPAPRGQGRFTIRCTPSGARVCMYRYTRPDGTRDVLKVGDYDSRGNAGLTLQAARERAGHMAKDMAQGINLRQQQAVHARAAERQAIEAELPASGGAGSLAAMYALYVQTLLGRPSHADAKALFRLHLAEPFPALAAAPAATVRAKELRDVLARLVGQGKGRTAGKFRAYLRAAFSCALKAPLDPTLPQALAAAAVQVNPADRLPSLVQYNKALDRTLTLGELRAFWTHLLAAPETAARDAVVCCVLLGGQRPTQVLRASPRDVDLSARTITLRDTKGRNRHMRPRHHVLPLVDAALPVIQRRLSLTSAADAPLFSSKGTVPVRKESAAAVVEAIAQAMTKARELEKGHFTLRDLRRTAETQMAALGVSRDTRAQVQSHGLGGVQDRHYDRHDYMAEKRAAIEAWIRVVASRVTS